MSKTTDFLKLFKYDLAQDGAQNFDIVKALNENWDKIEAVLAGTAAEDAAKALHNLIGAAAALEQAGLATTDLVGVDDVSEGTGKKVTLQNLATYLAGIGGAAKIQTGSYVGTGTYGADNPCKLTFDFPPRIFSVRIADSGNNGSPRLWFGGESLGDTGNTYYFKVRLTWSDNTLNWYAYNNSGQAVSGQDIASYQMNTEKNTYAWFAFG